MHETTRVCALSWGELLWDLFPSGATLGGAPSNLAVHLAATGLPTALVTRVGSDDLGDRARTQLVGRGIDARGLQVDGELQTGRVGIALENGEPRYTLHPGAWQRIRCDEAAMGLLRESRAFCFGTLSQESAMGLESWRQALEYLDTDAIRFCDPNLRGGRIDPELVLEHLRAATIVKINEDEAAVFESTFGCRDATAWLLGEMEVQLVAKTLGPKGALLTSANGSAHHAGFAAAPGGDNVGAGDAFGAILVRGVIAGAPLDAIAEAANRYGSFVASSRGATPTVPDALRLEVATLLGLGGA